MRMSEFWRLMDDEFGTSYGRLLARSHAIHALGDLTVEQALAAHHTPRAVWAALCDDLDIPPERRLGEDLPISDNPQEP